MTNRSLTTTRCVAGGSLLLAVAGCGRTESAPPPAPPPVRVQVAQPGATAHVVRYSASIQPVKQVNLAFKVGGYVAEIASVFGVGGGRRPLQDGDRVTAGSVLARVQQADYQVQVNAARAQLSEAEAGRGQAAAQSRAAEAVRPQAEAQLAAARAMLEKAERDFTRATTLYQSRSLTRADHDAARAALDTARANVNAARAAVEAAGAQIDTARAQLQASEAKLERARQQLTAAEIPLADTALRAPLDAVVLSRKVEVGSLVQPGVLGFVLASTGIVKAVFSVPDHVVRGLALGRLVSVTGDLGPDAAWRGPITSISASADPQSRVFQVEVTLANPRGGLRPGMIVAVTLADEARPAPHPAVPLSALVRPAAGAEGYAVFIVENRNGKPVALRRAVVLGDVVGNGVLVREGLAVGERVVVSGATLLTDGQAVAPES